MSYTIFKKINFLCQGGFFFFLVQIFQSLLPLDFHSLWQSSHFTPSWNFPAHFQGIILCCSPSFLFTLSQPLLSLSTQSCILSPFALRTFPGLCLIHKPQSSTPPMSPNSSVLSFKSFSPFSWQLTLHILFVQMITLYLPLCLRSIPPLLLSGQPETWETSNQDDCLS